MFFNVYVSGKTKLDIEDSVEMEEFEVLEEFGKDGAFIFSADGWQPEHSSDSLSVIPAQQMSVRGPQQTEYLKPSVQQTMSALPTCISPPRETSATPVNQVTSSSVFP